MATCLYAVYDPVSHRITIANAGHPPPVLLHLGGRAEVLRVPPGAPIGVGGVDFEAVELDAPGRARPCSCTPTGWSSRGCGTCGPA